MYVAYCMLIIRDFSLQLSEVKTLKYTKTSNYIRKSQACSNIFVLFICIRRLYLSLHHFLSPPHSAVFLSIVSTYLLPSPLLHHLSCSTLLSHPYNSLLFLLPLISSVTNLPLIPQSNRTQLLGICNLNTHAHACDCPLLPLWAVISGVSAAGMTISSLRTAEISFPSWGMTVCVCLCMYYNFQTLEDKFRV